MRGTKLAGVHEQAAAALRELSAASGANQARIGEHDGVEALVRSLRLHGGAPALVPHITHTLYGARSLLASGLHSSERAGKFVRTGGCSAPSSRRCNAAPS